MFNRYYQQELQNLRDLAGEFSKRHPAAAPMLSNQSADPDVERLLEGVAFLTGMLRQKMDDELPEIVRGLMDVVLPHYLRPIPAASVVVFTPKASMLESIRVPVGTSLRSVPVEDTDCVFRTCFDLEVHPLALIDVDTVQRAGEQNRIRLTMELKGLNLSQWRPTRLTFFLGGAFAQASDLFMLLTRRVQRIRIVPASGGEPCELSPDFLKPIGFDPQNSIFPFPFQAFSGYRLLLEYFILPQKFLFFDLLGWEQWQTRGAGSRFEIIFDLLPSQMPLPTATAEQFLLFATPVVNLFPTEADPVTLDHRQERVPVRPPAMSTDTMQIYSVDQVTGCREGSVEKKEYAPIILFSKEKEPGAYYQVVHGISPVHGRPEVYLTFAYPPEAPEPIAETISIKLTCTNGGLPERLQLGDICRQTFDSPELLEFRNIISPTAPVDPLLAGEELWSFLSHLSLNLLSLMDLEGLKELLRLYIFPKGRDRVNITANLKRVEGIVAVTARPADSLVRGFLVRGREIEIQARQDHFASTGDLVLFGSVMDRFFSEYSSINSFTRFRIREMITGETFKWPDKVGGRPLA